MTLKLEVENYHMLVFRTKSNVKGMIINLKWASKTVTKNIGEGSNNLVIPF